MPDPIVVTRDVIEYVLLHLLRLPAVFQKGRAQLAPEHFNMPGETPYRITWEQALAYEATHASLPGYQWLSMAVINKLGNTQSTVSELAAPTDDFLRWVYDKTANPDSALCASEALNCLQQLLLERQVHQPLEQLVEENRAGSAVDSPTILTDLMDRVHRIQTITKQMPTQVLPDTWEEVQRPTIPTGVPMIDVRMQGGSEPGEVNILLAPTGVGKSLLGMQLTMSSGHLAYASAKQHPETDKLAVYISYEEPYRSTLIRALSYAAEIPQDRLQKLKSYDQLSTAGNLEEYEQQGRGLQRAAGHELPAERERFDTARKWIESNVRLLDFSGSREQSDIPRGYGGISEIRAELDALQEQTEKEIRLVVIDWAGAGVRKSLRNAEGSIQSHLSHQLEDYVGAVHDQITAPMSCIGWILHQVRGDANKRSPTFKLTHADALWCKSFGVMAWFAFVLGNKCEDTGTCLLTATKTRRGASCKETVCRIDGAMGRLVEDTTFVPNYTLGKIISKVESTRTNVGELSVDVPGDATDMSI